MTEIDQQLAEFNRLRAKRKSMSLPGPTNSAATIKPSAKTMGFHARRATHRARISAGQLEASKARVAEAQAALEARKELAAKQAAAREAKAKLAATQAALAESARQESAVLATPALSPRDQRRAAAKGTLADQSDSSLRFTASHRSATDADRTAAKAELERRGWTIHANGSFSQSIHKASRR